MIGPAGWQQLFDERGVVCLDGGLATELEKRGADLNHTLWSARLLLDDPQMIEEVHYDYFCSGADVATTATYQATIPGLRAHGLSEAESRVAIRTGVEAACRARDRHTSDACLIAGSVGCYGAYLHDGSEYRGDYRVDRQQLVDFHAPRLELLSKAGVDLFALETIPCLFEARILIELIETSFDLPAWLSCSCRDGQHLCNGDDFLDVVRMANDATQIIAVGVNCTSPVLLPELLRGAAPVSRKPLLVYPNRGETFVAETSSWSADAVPLDFFHSTPQWREAGARVIGGCCRTTPADIRAIRRALLGEADSDG